MADKMGTRRLMDNALLTKVFESRFENHKSGEITFEIYYTDNWMVGDGPKYPRVHVLSYQLDYVYHLDAYVNCMGRVSMKTYGIVPPRYSECKKCKEPIMMKGETYYKKCSDLCLLTSKEEFAQVVRYLGKIWNASRN